MRVFPSAATLIDLTEKYHLLPFVLYFLTVGVLTNLTMLGIFAFRCASELVDSYYDMRLRIVESQRRFRERSREQLRRAEP